MISSTWLAWRPGPGCWRSGARPGRRRSRWRGAGSGSRASSWGRSWPRRRGATWRVPGSARRSLRPISRSGGRRGVSFSIWCTPRRRGTGSIRRGGTGWRGRSCARAAISRSGRARTSCPTAATRFSTSSRRSTRRSARACRPGLCGRAPGQLTDLSADIEASGLFSVICVRQYDWERVYDAEGYIELLDTFSGHIAMAPWQRERLYGEIRRRLAGRPSGTLRRHWGAALHVARRR